MKVYFIRAGPGAPDLITLRSANLLGRVDMVFYAGSLVPAAMLQHCHADAELIDKAMVDLEQQQACYQWAQKKRLQRSASTFRLSGNLRRDGGADAMT